MGIVARSLGILLLVASALAVVATGLFLVLRPPAPPPPAQDAIPPGRTFVVSAPDPQAAEAGREVLRAGGNAMDAAVAVQATLGLVEPAESGLGGGGFLLYREGTTGRLFFYDGRETAPAAATADRFRIGPLTLPLWAAVPAGRSVGVPGMVDLLGLAHARHGRMDWATALAPAVLRAREGVPMPARLQRQLRDDPSLWLFPDLIRRYLPVAPRLADPAYAQTLDTLAAEGPRAFYEGPIAEALLQRVRRAAWLPSDLTRQDLARYRAVEREPLCRPYREWTVCGAPPPTAGGLATLQILGMLEHFDMQAHGPDSVTGWHLLAEAGRLAFADLNAWVGDPDFVPVPVEGLLDRGYLARRAALISPDRARDRVPVGDPIRGRADSGRVARFGPLSAGTAHFSIVDGQGNVVSMTSSIEMPFGSRMRAAGMLLNNQLTDFDFEPLLPDGRTNPNAVAGGKRPSGSMSPTIVLDARGNVRLVIGARGGSRIIGHVTRVLVATLDWGLDLQSAIALSNLVHRGKRLEIEQGSALAERAHEFSDLGHRPRILPMAGGLHGFERRDGYWHVATDPRHDGAALTE
ncbi:MAG: gamma-glutamyltransferase family protein [Halothiobacillaceae bacterium]